MGEPRIKGQLLKGTTQLLVLAVLKDGEQYGYEIAQQLKARTGGVFALNEGALYPALHALESAGALEAFWRASDKGPKRRYYRITPAGRGLLETQQQEWVSFNAAMAKAIG
ncbi:MAG: helix-turn-helix transcriptional regulator [Chloroflexota bacterium]